jgi:hypothetical protein
MNLEEEIEFENSYEDEAENNDVDSLDEGELNPINSSHKKVVLDKADRSLSELHRWYKSGRIIIDPEWQRNYGSSGVPVEAPRCSVCLMRTFPLRTVDQAESVGTGV